MSARFAPELAAVIARLRTWISMPPLPGQRIHTLDVQQVCDALEARDRELVRVREDNAYLRRNHAMLWSYVNTPVWAQRALEALAWIALLGMCAGAGLIVTHGVHEWLQ